MALNNLPGVQVNTIDGGLIVRRVPSAKSVLILGTAVKGPANNPYAVFDRAVAAQIFGFSGNLVRALEEVSIGGSDNITLFRIGTTPATLAKVGQDTGSVTTAGFTITFGQVDSDVGTEYSIWYKAGVLYIWDGTLLVYANDTSNNVVVDTGDITFSADPSGNLGMQFGTSTVGSLANSITVSAAAAQAATGTGVKAVFTDAIIGTNMTGRETFIALAKALDLLDIYPVDEVVVPDATLDAPNVAFNLTPGDINDPTTNPDALDWLKAISDSFGGKTYQWANDSTDSDGGTVTPMVAANAAARLEAGFFEVNYAHLLANFAFKQEKYGLNGTCVVFLGTSQPKTFKIADIRKWVGYAPLYDPTVVDATGAADIKVITDGAGLFGNPYLAGCTTSRLNSLVADSSTGRSAGLFLTDNGMYDGVVQLDKNGNFIDIGAYVHVMADVAILSNGFKNGYVANLAPYAAGYTSGLDDKVNLTNHPVKATQLWKPNSVQLDAATFYGINFLRYKGPGNLPCFTHGQTAATNVSDYKNLLRQRIKGLVVTAIRETADPFLGYGSVDGLQLQAMQTALTNRLMILQKRGYISKFNFTVTTSPGQQRLGHATIDVNFNPADELVQLTASVAVSRS